MYIFRRNQLRFLASKGIDVCSTTDSPSARDKVYRRTAVLAQPVAPEEGGHDIETRLADRFPRALSIGNTNEGVKAGSETGSNCAWSTT